MPAPTPDLDPADVELRNRLDAETSPYLLQHQHNPVHWFGWGPEAFAAARALDRPIFLSVGYSTCYWCHVMERESFESEAIAEILNEHFVCIKVDREERPDVDDLYMAAVQLLNQGQGGWPMSVFLEPEGLRPFLAGTYFPPADGPRGVGFPSVLRQVRDYWSDQREDVMRQAQGLADAIAAQQAEPGSPVAVGPRQVERGASMLLSQYDARHGGFGSAPKFPTPAKLDFLMAATWEYAPYREAVLHTLNRMATGGMYDQIGGGFHRYSVDERWLVPHFEKMLYDNAQLVSTYAEAYRRTQDPFYAEVMRETLAYVQREMTGPDGAFFSAQDAEVNAREGENYLWTVDELEAALADAGLAEDAAVIRAVYGFDEGTNFVDPHHPDDGPKNVVHLTDTPANLAAAREEDVEDFDARLARGERGAAHAAQHARSARARRQGPGRLERAHDRRPRRRGPRPGGARVRQGGGAGGGLPAADHG